ncbi:MAG TPA: hydrolase, partial [Kribbella sp.]|nr:hydrolase [Kribbella sp.]
MRFFRAAVSVLLLLGVPTPAASAAEFQGRAVTSQTFRNPVNPSADPSMMFYNGKYYVATTRGDRIGIWSST